jgi:S-adenosylmethionine:tRNA ribosyltransferase-isomerase
MDVSLFDYHLPPDLIAQHPPAERGDSRMLVLSRAGGTIAHRSFRDLPEYLRPGDCLVINETQVIPARLLGRRRPTAGRVELLLLRALADRRWEALARPARRLRPGTTCDFGENEELQATVVEYAGEGRVIVDLECEGDLLAALDRVGAVPLPPYIRGGKAELADKQRYQTVYAREPGAVAAPTAGLHFDEAMFRALEAIGVATARVTLHVGLGTFRPVEAERVEDHAMHAEFYEVGEGAAATINAARAAGGRIVAVGTTSVRTLETVADEHGEVVAGSGWTQLFITPGYRFRAVDAMLTNFHLPRSTLLMMVSAFAGREIVLRAYAEATEMRYRFYSYGDCMLLH